jgi:hypothetical protein
MNILIGMGECEMGFIDQLDQISEEQFQKRILQLKKEVAINEALLCVKHDISIMRGLSKEKTYSVTETELNGLAYGFIPVVQWVQTVRQKEATASDVCSAMVASGKVKL